MKLDSYFDPDPHFILCVSETLTFMHSKSRRVKKILNKFKITKFKNKGRIDDPNVIIIRGPEPCFAKSVANKGSQK